MTQGARQSQSPSFYRDKIRIFLWYTGSGCTTTTPHMLAGCFLALKILKHLTIYHNPIRCFPKTYRVCCDSVRVGQLRHPPCGTLDNIFTRLAPCATLMFYCRLTLPAPYTGQYFHPPCAWYHNDALLKAHPPCTLCHTGRIFSPALSHNDVLFKAKALKIQFKQSKS